MNSLNEVKKIRLIIAIFIAVISTLLWYSLFISSATPQNDTDAKYDDLAKEPYSLEEVNSNSVVNPNSPYFIGINLLKERGVSFDEEVYIRDVITNFTLNEKNIPYAKISIVDDSFMGPVSDGADSTYEFDFAINDETGYSVKSVSNIVDETITVFIQYDDKTVFDKKFDIVQPV